MPALAVPRGATLSTMLTCLSVGPLAAAELSSYRDGQGNELVPSLSLEAAFFPQSQSWFGKSKDNLGETSNYWFEEVGKLALDGQVSLDGSAAFTAS